MAGNVNDGESLTSWQARRARQKALGRNGNGAGTPPSVAVRPLPTPAAGDAAVGCDPATPPGGVRPSGAKKQVHLAAVAAWHLAPPSGDPGGQRLLPTPTVVMTWRTPAGHLAWRHVHGRVMPCDLQAAVTLLPTPDTGTSPRGHGRRGGRPGNGHQSGQSLDALATALPAPPALTPAAVNWGPYEAAVRRWEHLLGHPVPVPTEPGKSQRPRLAAGFAEWLMGIPGWVTEVEGIPRTAQLRLIGNGVVPQQGAAALQMLIAIAARYPATACPAMAGGTPGSAGSRVTGRQLPVAAGGVPSGQRAAAAPTAEGRASDGARLPVVPAASQGSGTVRQSPALTNPPKVGVDTPGPGREASLPCRPAAECRGGTAAPPATARDPLSGPLGSPLPSPANLPGGMPGTGGDQP